MPWPSYSPDLNPIENVWAILKHNVEKKVKSIVATKKSVSKEAFIALVEKEWVNLLLEVITSNICSMSNCIKACIEMEGGHTMY